MSIALYLIVILCLVLFPQDTAGFAGEALQVWGKNIVPFLFPYMVFSRLLSRSIRQKQRSLVPVSVILGMLGGSPSGAALLAACADKLSYRLLCALCALTTTISPMFILGTIQFWTNDTQLCRVLLLCHWMGAALSAGIIYVCTPNQENLAYTQNSALADSSNPIADSIDAILQVGGCIICYSVLAGMLSKIPALSSDHYMIIHAVMEISGGTHAITQSSFSRMQKSLMLCTATGFGSFSILTQNFSFLKHTGLGMGQLAFFSAVRACFCLLLMIGFDVLNLL